MGGVLSFWIVGLEFMARLLGVLTFLIQLLFVYHWEASCRARSRHIFEKCANVMLTRYKPPLKLKDWALAIAKRSTMRKARIALARRLAIIMHAMLRHGTEFKAA
jgi:hypothetical protein